jgi:GPH family glycoside/pentoside/hexuronide:cation symporter
MSASPSAPASSPTPAPADDSPLPWRLRLAYGFGGFADRIGNQGLKDMGNPIYNLVLGINPALIGTVFVITRLFDAFFDPVVGNWSDNHRGRWGRRTPFILVGGLLSAVTVVPVFWIPLSLTGTAQTAWLLTSALVFYAAFTLFNVPYRALAYELAPGYHQKTQILGTRTLFTILGALLAPWAYPFLQSGWFGTPQEMVPIFAVTLGVVMLASILVPALLVREPAGVAAAVQNQRRVSLKESLGHTFGCRPFRLLVAMGASTVAGVNVGFGFGSYLAIYHVFGGDGKAAGAYLGWFGTVFVVSALVGVPLSTAISRRLGKSATQLLLLGWAALGSVLSWWFYSPEHPWLQLLLPLFLSPGTVGLWMFGESMVADVCAAEARRTGERHEAMFSAVFGWILKAATAVAILASNLLLNATGFDVAAGARQAEGVVHGLRVIYLAFPLVGFLGSIFFLWRYHQLQRPAQP